MQNFLIKGDSTEKLKTLHNEFKEQFKLIYIDPPYNTERSDMTYDDKRELTDFYNLLTTTFNDSKPLLRNDGIICVSISAHSLHHIRNVMDSVYGKDNYAGTIIRLENAKKQKIGGANLKENFEYVVCYFKNKDKKRLNFIVSDKYKEYSDLMNKLSNTLNKNQHIEDLLELKTENINFQQLKILKKIWSIQEESKGLKQYKYFNQQPFRAADINMYLGKGSDFDIIHPITGQLCKRPKYNYPNISKIEGDFEFENNILRFKEEPIFVSESKILCGNIIFGINENKIPDYKNNLDIMTNPDMIVNITGSEDRYLTSLFNGVKVFDYPKPLKLLDYILDFSTQEGDYVLDYFAGSGTTGEAAFNKKRHFVLIQKDDEIKESLKIELNKKGFNDIDTIYDITKTRLNLSGVKFICK